VEALHERVVADHVGERDQRHALVMRESRPAPPPAGSGRRPGCRCRGCAAGSRSPRRSRNARRGPPPRGDRSCRARPPDRSGWRAPSRRAPPPDRRRAHASVRAPARRRPGTDSGRRGR
jgi:hypothetical protein